jgi:hypothetical protein
MGWPFWEHKADIKKFNKYIELRQAHYGEVLLLVSQIADWTDGP